ncbi:LOW QUALITY PROTEIN: hypothetical protein KUTeg_004458 [Tegillarca granosa]|uniref:Amidase domain-containing protein n=1 Tax=Tegillarca granosa TaxID=220873 RepID=A0ABQ9FRR0_TEGGR|nr:LOW QUALITY PROTEIN: hypothetical protein KUTeg_004458 [Tegillarca granosa]
MRYWRCDIKGSEDGKLAGKTIGIKDNVAVAGVPMMNGSKTLEGYTPEFDATVVTRILDVGGRIVGKTNCEDLCCSGSSWSSSTGPVRNPYDKTRTTGGSSSGSALLLDDSKEKYAKKFFNTHLSDERVNLTVLDSHPVPNNKFLKPPDIDDYIEDLVGDKKSFSLIKLQDQALKHKVDWVSPDSHPVPNNKFLKPPDIDDYIEDLVGDKKSFSLIKLQDQALKHVARGEVDMTIGGDQGGSIRMPASWCGVVGMKPSWGLVPYTGAMSVEYTVDHLGPITKTVENCALFLEVIAGYDDGRDARQPANLTIPEYSSLMNNAERRSIGLLKEGFENADKGIRELVRAAALQLQEPGAVVEDTSIPLHSDGNGYMSKSYYPLSMQEAMARGRHLRPYDLSVKCKMYFTFSEYMNRHYQTKFYSKGQNLNPFVNASLQQCLTTL